VHQSVALFHVDAFTGRPFAGNPAAVCLLERAADPGWMQAVGAEMNLSETAFVWPVADGFGLRWFTPVTEVDLCGHATLASAHVLWQHGGLRHDSAARFHTRGGVLAARREDGHIVLDFPACPARPAVAPPGLLESLGIPAREVFCCGSRYLVEVADEDTLRGLRPDFPALARVDLHGVMVTTRSSQPAYDFLSRYFAPAAGVDEDPVTGSAHCTLGPFWSSRLHKTELRAYQASPRGGEVSVTVQGDRILLAGSAVTVSTGRLQV